VHFLAEPAYEHLDNHHPPLTQEQTEDLNRLTLEVTELLKAIKKLMDSSDFDHINNIIIRQQQTLTFLQKLKKKQVKMIQAEKVGTRNSLLYFNILAETKNLLLFTVNMLKAHRDFILYKNIPSE
jgi:Na+/phosphate symporter